jgi:hypothetical protein
MHVLKGEGRGPKFTTALVTGLLAVGTTMALGAPQAYAAPKAKAASTTTTSSTTSSTTLVTPSTTVVSGKASRITASAPTTTSTTATTVLSSTSTTSTSTTSTTSATEVRVDKVSKVTKKLATANAPTVPTSSTVPSQAEATTTVPSSPTTTSTSTTTTSRPGRTAVTRAKTQAIVTARVPGQCGRTPLGPVTNGETITTTGTVTLTTPVILDNCTDVTFNGGNWIDPNTSPGKAYGGGVGNGRPAFDIISGSNVTVENLRINGANKGGAYREDLAFNSGIWTDGTAGLTISNVKVAHVFGDCLTLAPLRSGMNMNGIVAPVRNLTVDQFTANACGRQGIALSSVNGAVLTNITIGATAFDAFDAEADQPGKEGAMNVTVNGGPAPRPRS